MNIPKVDPRLFRYNAKYYLKYRSNYPSLLIERVAQICDITSASRVLDLGCGPGMLAHAFAPFCAEVIGVDPEPCMIEAAKEYNDRGNTHFLCASAHELSPQMGNFSITVIGRAFHWMDRQATLATLETMIDPNGAVVLFRDPAVEHLQENQWMKEFDRVFDEFAATEAARLGAKHCDAPINEAHLLRSTFNKLERVSMFVRHHLTIEHVIGRAFTIPGTSPEALGIKRPAFEEAMRVALEPFTSAGVLVQITEPEALIARR